MSLARTCLVVCFLIASLEADARDFGDWQQWRETTSEERFRQCLKDLEEKPLEPLADERSREIYRMVYLPSFFPQVSMRVNVVPNGTGRLTMRSIPPYCGDRDPPIAEKQRALSAADVAVLREAYTRADFWHRAKIEGNDGADGVEAVVCTDGASVYLEAVRDGRHHRISRTCLWDKAIEDTKAVFHHIAREKDPHTDM
jgi:hypothetical protein